MMSVYQIETVAGKNVREVSQVRALCPVNWFGYLLQTQEGELTLVIMEQNETHPVSGSQELCMF